MVIEHQNQSPTQSRFNSAATVRSRKFVAYRPAQSVAVLLQFGRDCEVAEIWRG